MEHWNSIGARFSFSQYLSPQKYSLFDNETDEISIANQQQYGSTNGSSRVTEAVCFCKKPSALVPSILSSDSQCHSAHCTLQHMAGDQSLNSQLRSPLKLMSSHYEPVPIAPLASTVAKQDPIAVLPVSSSTSRHSTGDQLLVERPDDYHNLQSGTKSSKTTFDVTGRAETVLSSSGKGQLDLQLISSGENCLFSRHSLSHLKAFSASKQYSADSPFFTSSFSLKSKRANRDRLRVATAIMGVTSILLLIAFVVFLKVTNHEASPTYYQGSPLPGSGLKGSSGTVGSFNQQTAGRMCQSEACRDAGKTLYESINFTINPCDDFFEFACGNWIAQHPIPDEKRRIGTFNMLDDTLTENMKQILEGGNSVSNSSVANSVKFALDMYQECMDRETIEQLGHEPLKQELTKVLGTSWPIVNADEFEGKYATTNFSDTFVGFYSIGFGPIVTFVVQPDANETTARRIYFDSPNFGMGRKEYANQTAYKSQVAAYRKYQQGVASLFASKDADEKLVQARLQEIFEFETKLALASTPVEDRRNAEVWYNKMSLNEFKQLTESRFDWTELLVKYTSQLNLSYLISDDDLVIVEDIPYYKAVSQLLDDTPDYVLYNYMGWMFARQFTQYMGKEMQDLAFEYRKATQGVKVQLPFWKQCVKQVYAELNFAISRLYVDQFVPKATKQTATQLIKDLKDAFTDIVRTGSWLDDTTRTRALDKITGIRENVAYPEWILNNEELDKYYGFTEESSVSVEKGKYFSSILHINRFSMGKMYRELPLAVNLTTDWPMSPATVNAAYAPTQNSITIPVGILRPPFFDPGRPVFMNYGGIGSVIGHEITHGFDDQGQQFDKSGNLIDWWTDEAKQRFTKGAQCFIDQYGSIIDPGTKKNLNGINTVGENVADNGGVRESYLAFRAYAEKNSNIPLVPYLSKEFSVEQIFFLSYANVWCGTTRPESMQTMIDYDPHAPLKYRVNVPLSNFDQFGKAFQCSIGTPMNSKSKCTLW